MAINPDIMEHLFPLFILRTPYEKDTIQHSTQVPLGLQRLIPLNSSLCLPKYRWIIIHILLGSAGVVWRKPHLPAAQKP